jgi:aspartate/methionine/tyrosine aminotransferase
MDSLRGGDTHYVDVPGNAELRRQIGAYLQAAGIAIGGAVLVTAGIQESRFLTVQVLGKALGKIAFPRVVHPGVRECLGLRDLNCVFVEVGPDQEMLIPPAAVGKLESDVKVLYLESPSRLTGACYTKQQFDEIVSLCKKKDVTIIVDSGLHALVDDSCHHSDIGLEIDDTTLLIGEAWPATGIEELCIGYIASSESMVKKITTQKQVISICTSAPSQNGAIAAGVDYMKRRPEFLASVLEKRSVLEAILKSIGARIVSNPVVNFVLCVSDPALQQKLDAAKIRYSDSSDFGLPGFIQLSVSEKIIGALQ